MSLLRWRRTGRRDVRLETEIFLKVRTLRRIRISLGSVDGVKSEQTAFSATGMTVRAGPYRSPADELEHDELVPGRFGQRETLRTSSTGSRTQKTEASHGGPSREEILARSHARVERDKRTSGGTTFFHSAATCLHVPA